MQTQNTAPQLTEHHVSGRCSDSGNKKTITCSECRLSGICMPIALSDQELNQLDDLILRAKPNDKSDYLYRMGDEFKAVYAIRSGSFKSYVLSESGTEQVTGFYLPGDVIGVDGLAQQHYSNNMVALERSTVCKIPFEQLEDLSMHIPALQRNIFRIMGSEITREQQMITLLGSCTAEQKLASFLLGLSEKFAERGQSNVTFNLSMTRGDIANYLGLTIETVSRLLGQFKKKGAIETNNKTITILDQGALSAIVQKEKS